MKQFRNTLRKYRLVLSAVCLVCVLLTGCSAAKETEGDTAGEEWKVRGFVRKNSSELSFDLPETEYHEARYSKLGMPDLDCEGSVVSELYDYHENAAYTVYGCRTGTEQKYVLTRQETDIEEAGQWQLFTDAANLPGGYVACMDVITDSDIALLFVTEAEEYLILHADANGRLVSRTDVTEAYQKNGIGKTELVHGFWWCDRDNSSYVVTGEGKKLTVFSGDGGCALTRDYSSGEFTELLTAFHTPEGDLIAVLSDGSSRRTTLLWFDVPGKRDRELAVLNYSYLQQFTMQGNGDLYYSVGNWLYRWNVITGQEEKLFDYSTAAISNNATEYVEHVSVTGEELYLYVLEPDGRAVCVLTDREEQAADRITLLDMACYGTQLVKSCTASFSRSREGIPVQCEIMSGDAEDAWRRVTAELAAGKGPDILCLKSDDGRMQILHDKGVLADLTELISPEVKTQMFPGIVESGCVNGDWVGFIPEASAQVLAVSDDVWDKDSWTLEDVFSIMKNNEQIKWLCINSGMQPRPEDFLFVMLDVMGEEPFIDRENKESHLDGELFRRILKAGMEYSTERYDIDTLKELVEGGQCLMADGGGYGESDLIWTVMEYSEGCHFVGYPGQENYVGYWYAPYVLVVNQNSPHKERIGEYFEYMLEKDNQNAANAIGVMENVARSNVYYDEFASPPSWLYKNWRGGIPIGKPDGSTYLEEIVDCMSHLGPCPITLPNPVRMIIVTEARAYYNGELTLEQAVEIIDNRVQLYLDEQ